MLLVNYKHAIRFGLSFLRRMCSNVNEVEFQSHLPEKNTKCLKIAILGLPNAGKSTLINQLTRRMICATSCKVHTTQGISQTIYSYENTQLIFIDTPGLVTPHEYKKYKLKESFKKDPKTSIEMANVVGVIHDVSNTHTKDKLHKDIIELLHTTKSNIPTLLILNKVDLLQKKHTLLYLVQALSSEKHGWPHFSDIFMVSAMNGDGVEDLRNYLLDSATVEKWQYGQDVYTNKTPETIIKEVIQAKLLDNLPHEVPYQLIVNVQHYEVRPDLTVYTIVEIQCPMDRFAKLLLKGKGKRIKLIASESEETLRNAFQTTVFLNLMVKHRGNK